MADREKVMKTLELCSRTRACSKSCIYWNYGEHHDGVYCRDALMKDALELLKDTEPVKPYLSLDSDRSRVWCCRSCDAILAYAGCEDRPWERNRYCRMCGKPLKWEVKNGTYR